MANFFITIFFISLLLAVEFINDAVVKNWTLGKAGNGILLVIFFIHILAFGLWILAMKYEAFSKVIILYSILSIVGGVIIGVTMFHDKLSTVNIVGVFLAILSVILIGIG